MEIIGILRIYWSVYGTEMLTAGGHTIEWEIKREWLPTKICDRRFEIKTRRLLPTTAHPVPMMGIKTVTGLSRYLLSILKSPST